MDTQKYLGIALLVVVAILIGAVTYFYSIGDFETQLQLVISGPWRQLISKKTANSEVNSETANWKTYTNKNSVTFKYPNNWVVSETKYRSAAQEISGQESTVVGYGLTPNPKKTPYDVISIGGLQFSCLVEASYQSRCVSTKEVGEVHTQSKDPDILKIFDMFIKQFTIVKNYK